MFRRVLPVVSVAGVTIRTRCNFARAYPERVAAAAAAAAAATVLRY